MSPRTPAEVLAAARRTDSLRKRQNVLAALQSMIADGDRITFKAVARQAGVSTWLVYAEGVREHIDSAIRKQEHAPATARQDGRQASNAGLKAELAIARQEIGTLRNERDRLREAVRQQLGQQLDQVSNRHLVDRITELTEACRQLEQSRDQALAEAETLRGQVTTLDADLAATRTSLRRMIRDENHPSRGELDTAT
ncbi:DUF6262 family protein [Streptacidiphilus anmyonensis]|uniref:DUF6262 family protein n=1 Tax=Streptacidiphilus anmyonensis TaxID=405782 RepID=UPI000B13ED0E|nr:DUF6262 family protein [Streptacidiphilus anmyonensis]